MTKSKILHVIATLDPTHGGPIQGLQNYIPEFYDHGMKNEVLCLDSPSAPYLNKSVFPVIHAMGPCQRPWAYTSKLLPWLKSNGLTYDVIIVHGLWLYHGYAVMKAISYLEKTQTNQSGIPKVFVMCHGMLDPYFQKAPERKLKAIRNEIYWRLIESKIVNNAAGVLFTCEEEMNLANQSFKSYNPKRTFNVGYGIKEPPIHNKGMDDAFYKVCPSAKERGFLLFLSRIHQKKGIELLIKAYQEIYVTKSRENVSFPVLVIAGPGYDTQYGRMLMEMVSIKEHIFFPGMLIDDTKWGAFYNCEAFVLPSHQENFGIAVAEALACSKPVLISNKINIWREINDARAGIVADDTLEGAKNLLHTWHDMTQERRILVGQNARLCFESYFSIKPAVNNLLKAITGR